MREHAKVACIAPHRRLAFEPSRGVLGCGLTRRGTVNLAWIVPKSGKPQSRNVHAKDRAKLLREGFVRHRLECVDAAGTRRVADVYAQRLPSPAEVAQAARDLFGATSHARLVDQPGPT